MYSFRVGEGIILEKKTLCIILSLQWKYEVSPGPAIIRALCRVKEIGQNTEE